MLYTHHSPSVLSKKMAPLRLHAFRAGLLALCLSAACGDPMRLDAGAPTPDASMPPPHSDAGEPDAGPCECPTGSRCVEGVCKETDFLQVSLSEHQLQEVDGGIARTSADARSCFYGIGDGGVATFGTVRVEGLCFVNGPIQDGGIVRSYIPIPGRGGPVSISGGTQQVTTADDPAMPCGRSSLDGGSDTYFKPGGQFVVTGAGGPGFPPFSATAPAMERMTIEPAMIRRGQPVQLRWPKGRGSEVSVFLVVGTETATGSIICLLPDTGEYTVSARLTEVFGDGAATYSYIRADRSVQVRFDPQDAGTSGELYVGSGVTRNVTYVP